MSSKDEARMSLVDTEVVTTARWEARIFSPAHIILEIVHTDPPSYGLSP